VTEPNSAPPGGAQQGNASAPVVPEPSGVMPTGQSGEPATTDTQQGSDPAWDRLKGQIRKLETENAKLRQAGLTESERAIEAAKIEGAKEYRAKWARATIENAALGILSERHVVATELALRALELDGVDVDPDNGKVDSATLTRRIDDLISRYPMLVTTTQQLPGVGVLQGAQQRQVQSGQLIAPQQNEQQRLNELARYALGGQG
jgi:hypothetical protein